MPRVVLTVRLHEGPHDGHRDWYLPPVPGAVFVAWCGLCRRVHVHPIQDAPEDPVALYELVGVSGLHASYRHVDVDVDDALDELLYSAGLGAGP